MLHHLIMPRYLHGWADFRKDSKIRLTKTSILTQARGTVGWVPNENFARPALLEVPLDVLERSNAEPSRECRQLRRARYHAAENRLSDLWSIIFVDRSSERVD